MASTLEEFGRARENRTYVGKKITIQVQNADLTDVLRLIGEASGFNLLIGGDVTGKITLSLVDVPWDQALDIVLDSNKLGAERSGNILRVATLSSLTSEKEAQLRAKQAMVAIAPRMTRIFPISYAKPKDLLPILQQFGSQGAQDKKAASENFVVDERTNSILVHDVGENIERIAKLIELLDTQTPQVLIEAKVIEASESFSKNIQGALGFGNNQQGRQSFFSFNGANPVDPLFGDPGVFEDGNAVSPLSSNGFGGGISPSFNLLQGLRMNALLSLSEEERKIKVVSSPRTVVLNKETATIVQGQPVLVPSAVLTQTGAITPVANVQNANLSLKVTPTVTNDGNIVLELSVTSDVPQTVGGGQSGIGNRQIDTKVVAESGSTLVIGGIYTTRTSRTEGGIPFLRKLPIVGALFGSETDNTDRAELFIFITPRTLNEKDSGFQGLPNSPPAPASGPEMTDAPPIGEV
jgi:type IV pilus assembly protein PilQ